MHMPHDATVPTADATKTLNPRVGGVGFRVWTIGFGDTAEPCGHKRTTLGLAELLQDTVTSFVPYSLCIQ